MKLLTPYPRELAEPIAAGDERALLIGVAATAGNWLHIADFPAKKWRQLRASHCLSAVRPEHYGLVAAALEMLAVLDASPQGRKALADLGLDPVEQDPEGPRR